MQEDWVLCRVFYKNREVLCGHGQAGGGGGGGASMGSCYDDTGSSCLPPLMDSYITFDQTQPNNLGDFYNNENNNNIEHHQQVPCFSLLSHNNNNNNIHHDQDHQANPIFSHINQLPNINTSTSTAMFGQVPFGSAFVDPAAALISCSSTSTDNKKVIKAVLNQYFDKLESSSNTPPPPPPIPPTTNYMMIMKGSSSSLGDQPIESSDSYLSEVGMPNNMWNNRY